MEEDIHHKKSEYLAGMLQSDEFVKKMELHEIIAGQMNRNGITSKALPLNSHRLEIGPYYSQNFAFSPKITTNRGCIKIDGKSIDYIHIIQRN